MTFKISIVMAAYNVAPYISEALDSVLSQSFNVEDLQIIIVNDGSLDNTKHICEEYVNRFPSTITLINKKNGGVSSARNEGLKHVQGVLVNFMDPDDKLGPDVLKNVWKYYEKIKGKTDVITIPIKQFGMKSGDYWQNFIFNKGTRVINLFEDFETMVSHTNSSFFVYNSIQDIVFEPNVTDGEDLKFLMDTLIKKMTLGVLDNCHYLYRVRDDGLLHTSHLDYRWYFNYFDYLNTPIILNFSNSMGYVPLFAQYVLMSNLQWRFKEYTTFNNIIGAQEFQNYKRVLFDSLKYFSDEVIIRQRNIDSKLKCFILCKKYGEKPSLLRSKNDLEIIVHTTKIEDLSSQRIQLEFIDIKEDMLFLDVSVNIFGINPDNKIVFTLEMNKKTHYCTQQKIIVDDDVIFDEPASYKFRFKFVIPLNSGLDIDIGDFGILYGVYRVKFKHIKFGKFFPISKHYKNMSYSFNNYTVKTMNDRLFISRTSKIQRALLEIKYDFEILMSHDHNSFKVAFVRPYLYLYRRLVKQKHWLVTDRVDKADDNGEAFFKYVSSKDSKKSFFAISKQSSDYSRIATIGKTVDIFSKRYKYLYLTSSLIISSNNDHYIIRPFEEHFFDDILYAIGHVFLQHGIIKDDLSSWLNKYNSNLNGFVTSTKREYQSVLNYEYYYSPEEVWLTGLPRYDYLEDKKSKIISIMPTWRKYLNDRNEGGVWKGITNFDKSDYYNFYNRLINDPFLISLCKKHGYSLLFIPHPNMQKYVDLFNKNDVLEIKRSNEVIYRDVFAKSSLLITDYSSVSFDFAYLRKPIVYCQFDIEAVWSKSHIGKEGYFDYESEGLGEVTHTVDETVLLVKEYMESGCNVKERYLERIMKFYEFHDHNNCKRIYDKAIKLERRIGNGH